MAKININTARKIVPMIYAYTTPEIRRHDGWTKIGYTEQDVDKRLNQQTHTADVRYHEEWRGTAIYDDGSGEIFSDRDLHAYLRKNEIEQLHGTEWFHITGPESKIMYYEFKANRGEIKEREISPYRLRSEQEEAVNKAFEYFEKYRGGQFLWNAKPRFGKTLATYELCKRLKANNILIVTNRPVIANSWYEDYEKFLGKQSGYYFVSSIDGLQGKPYVISRAEYSNYVAKAEENEDFHGCIEFVSLQDLK